MATDGRPANRVQAEGLAQAIARRREADIDIRDVDVNPFWRGIFLRLTRRGIGTVPQADMVIGAGRRGNVVAAQARRHGAKAIAILDPGLPLQWFDLVIAPAHDRLTAPNAIPTLGSLNTMTPQRIAEAAQGLPPMAHPALVALIGGPSKSAAFDVQPLIADIARFVAAGHTVYATASRRTPDTAVAALRARFPGMTLWNGTPPNPYPGWLHGADAILVTRDSVNMASEAAATGRPLFISDTGRIAPKFTRFHDTLRKRGITRNAADGPTTWNYTPLHEADRIAPEVLSRLDL